MATINSELELGTVARATSDGRVSPSKAPSRRGASIREGTSFATDIPQRVDASPLSPPLSTYFSRVTAYMAGRKTSLDVVSIARLICSPDNGPPSLPSPAIHRT